MLYRSGKGDRGKSMVQKDGVSRLSVIKWFGLFTLIALLGSLALLPFSVGGSSTERTSTGFYWPTGTSSLGNYAKWLADGCSWSGNNSYTKDKYHVGWDIAANEGGSVYAIADGKVISLSTEGWGVGNIGVLVEHRLVDGSKFIAVYGHVRSGKKVNDQLIAGESFATIGALSPPHLHFGVRPGTSLAAPYGRMTCPSKGPITDTNGFVDPINWIQTKTPFVELVGAPINFTGTVVSQTQIKLSWSDVANEQNYDLWRVRSGSSWEFVATLSANTVTYNDTGLSSETWYKYAIRAYRGNISSGWTYSTWVMTPGSPVAAPSNLRGSAASTTQINLTWQDNANNEQNLDLWRVSSGGSWQKVATLPANTVAYNDSGLSPETWYQYAIRAYRGSTTSVWTYSNWVKTP